MLYCLLQTTGYTLERGAECNEERLNSSLKNLYDRMAAASPYQTDIMNRYFIEYGGYDLTTREGFGEFTCFIAGW